MFRAQGSGFRAQGSRAGLKGRTQVSGPPFSHLSLSLLLQPAAFCPRRPFTIQVFSRRRLCAIQDRCHEPLDRAKVPGEEQREAELDLEGGKAGDTHRASGRAILLISCWGFKLGHLALEAPICNPPPSPAAAAAPPAAASGASRPRYGSGAASTLSRPGPRTRIQTQCPGLSWHRLLLLVLVLLHQPLLHPSRR